MVTIPIQTCIPTADLDYGEDIMFYVPQGGGAFDVWLHYKSYYTNTQTQY